MKQHAIGRLQFFATHRPKLRVRHVSVADPALTIGHPTLFYQTGERVKGGLVVVNIGGSDATVVETRYRIFFSKTGLPISAPYDEDFRTDLLMPNQILKPGKSCATPIADTIRMDAINPDGVLKIRPFERDGWTIYVMGQIRYADGMGAERFMGFCRMRDKTGKYRPSKTPITNTRIETAQAAHAYTARAPTR